MDNCASSKIFLELALLRCQFASNFDALSDQTLFSISRGASDVIVTKFVSRNAIHRLGVNTLMVLACMLAKAQPQHDG